MLTQMISAQADSSPDHSDLCSLWMAHEEAPHCSGKLTGLCFFEAGIEPYDACFYGESGSQSHYMANVPLMRRLVQHPINP